MTTAAAPRIKGITINFSGADYVVPPLSLASLEALHDRLKGFAGDVTDSRQLTTAIDAVHAGLRRNYPEMSREQVADMIDVGNMVEAFEAVMDVGGLRRKAAEAAAPAAAAP